MATIAEAFALAVSYAQAGQLSEAEQICQQIVAVDASCNDAWHLLGVIALQRGDLKTAADSLSRTVTANPADSEALNNLGIALQRLGKRDESIECFRVAVSIRPDFAEAQYNLANALHESGRIHEAIDAYRRALVFKPNDAVMHNNLANSLQAKGNILEAIAAYERAVALQPTYAEAHYNLGNAFKKAERDTEAIACYQRALELNPQYAEAHSNLGTLFQKQDNASSALSCYKRALELSPESEVVHFNLASGLHMNGDPSAAVEHYRQAIALRPDYAEAYSSLGSAFYDQGMNDDAIASFKRAIDLNPQYSDAHFGLAIALLKQGDLVAGYSEYEWRWKRGVLDRRDFQQPRWNGEPLDGRVILLHTEQGFGDTFQFIRFAPLVKRLGGTVVVECPTRLVDVLKRCAGIDHLIAAGSPLPTFDVHSPLLSLPHLFKTSLDTIPANTPYVFADLVLVDYWRQRMGGNREFRVGINWHGRIGKGKFLERDIQPECFAPLSQMPGVRLISLQKNISVDEEANTKAHLRIFDVGDDFDQSHGPFMDSAAVMNNLDLVITSDTSVAHLAGALGVAVWVALPSVADWRWMLNRPDSPWYPTMRLFRQKTAGDWTGVFAEITTALTSKLNSSS